MPLDLKAALSNSEAAAQDPARPWLLAPVDLQAVKACGVTYVRSMLERVIEERCRGDASQAEAVRAEVQSIIGDDLAALRPGSAEAAAVKAALVEKGWWSQYLEVGIGPDAEIPAGSEIIDLGDATLLPGFMDAHTHLSYFYNPDGRQAELDDLKWTPAEKAIRASVNARVTLMAGFTTVRDVGGSDFIDIGFVPRPRPA